MRCRENYYKALFKWRTKQSNDKLSIAMLRATLMLPALSLSAAVHPAMQTGSTMLGY